VLGSGACNQKEERAAREREELSSTVIVYLYVLRVRMRRGRRDGKGSRLRYENSRRRKSPVHTISDGGLLQPFLSSPKSSLSSNGGL